METFIQIIGALGIAELIKFFVTRSDSKKAYATKDDVNVLKQGLMAICQTTLEEKMQYHLNKGEISANQFKAISTMVNSYVALGGNDFIHELYEQLKEIV